MNVGKHVEIHSNYMNECREIDQSDSRSQDEEKKKNSNLLLAH